MCKMLHHIPPGSWRRACLRAPRVPYQDVLGASPACCLIFQARCLIGRTGSAVGPLRHALGIAAPGWPPWPPTPRRPSTAAGGNAALATSLGLDPDAPADRGETTAAIGAERKHVTLAANFCLPRESGHSRDGDP